MSTFGLSFAMHMPMHGHSQSTCILAPTLHWAGPWVSRGLQQVQLQLASITYALQVAKCVLPDLIQPLLFSLQLKDTDAYQTSLYRELTYSRSLHRETH